MLDHRCTAGSPELCVTQSIYLGAHTTVETPCWEGKPAERMTSEGSKQKTLEGGLNFFLDLSDVLRSQNSGACF